MSLIYSALPSKTLFIDSNTAFEQDLLVFDPKYSVEVINYAIDMSPLLLLTADSLVSFSLSLVQQALEPNDVAISVLSGPTDVPIVAQISGGTSGINYMFKLTFNTEQGFSWVRNLILPIQ